MCIIEHADPPPRFELCPPIWRSTLPNYVQAFRVEFSLCDTCMPAPCQHQTLSPEHTPTNIYEQYICPVYVHSTYTLYMHIPSLYTQYTSVYIYTVYIHSIYIYSIYIHSIYVYIISHYL